MAIVNLTGQVRVSAEATASVDDSGIVILDARGGRLFRSNGVGAAIWQSIEQQQPFETIVERICQRYQVGRTVAREHAARFVTELERNRLIVREVAA